MLVISRAEVERLLDMDSLIDGLATAFRSLSAGETSVPPRIASRTPAGLLAVMPGYVKGLGLATKAVSVFAQNHKLGLPSHQAAILLFDDGNGSPLALMDATHITATRTAAAAALSARLLARSDARVLAIIGAGVQGRSHLAALPRVRPFQEIRIASRNAEHAKALAAESRIASSASSFEQATRGADVVCCCTDSPEPVLRRVWVGPGTHVTSVGCSPEGPELDRETLTAGRLAVESRAAFQAFPAGAPGLEGLDPESAAELGEIIAGTRPGRQRPDEITVYRSMGHAVEDVVAARLVYDRAVRDGVGLAVKV